ncbi:MAG: TIM barrel protein [Candidatus Latescibacteria bacterium]|nr:TIM barrel protein [Candidatus Latescibacterota bacterium]
MLRFGVSGSTVLSASERLGELFWEGIDHIEIGSMASAADLDFVLQGAQARSLSVSFHSPLWQGGSKYDLLDQYQKTPQEAWDQVAEELTMAREKGVEYVLVHFPFFLTGEVAQAKAEEQIDTGLQRLAELQAHYGVHIVCEPKLGLKRDPAGLDILRAYPVERWRESGLGFCWDMGDYFLGTADWADCRGQLRRWQEVIDVIHVHNGVVRGDRHSWIPVHPSHEGADGYFPVAPFFAEAGRRNALFLWEHTPHIFPDRAFAQAGFSWARSLIEAVQKERSDEA